MTPAVKASRGTKRSCQNEACGLPFYDLNRDPIACPNCSAAWIEPPAPPPRTSYGNRSRSFDRNGGRPLAVVADPAIEEQAAEVPVAEAGGDEAILEVDLDEDDDSLAIEVEEEPQKDE